LGQRAQQGRENESREYHSQEESWTHGLWTEIETRFFPYSNRSRGLWVKRAGKKHSTTKGGRRMYIGLGTVLLIVLIIILLIWVF
jgi:hypothetical protein